ncbi:YwdI family protein [Virgibacillus sp. 179-BFC.A HS]|uniref:YwdI family protein n=1 Tax=Tigheibacillus jepli TaxID=3035914 RepID=A0ABU5CG38_9BACI|nr:YwdI family protein [Virgibacillus sp. 179-BFC.A HS]MDY0404515.1 YwdI family protein [Virgibacillus sp. 179-BFC.A HS]
MVSVHNETIFAKMAKELEKATENQHNADQMLQHVANIKLLCELFLDQKPADTSHHPVSKKSVAASVDDFTAAELKTMLGTSKGKQPASDSDKEDGLSIFDF